MQQTTYAAVITDGQLVLNQDQTYDWRVNFRVTQNGVASTAQWHSSGTFSRLIVLGKHVLTFVDESDSNLMRNISGDESMVSGTARPPTSIVPDLPDRPVLVALQWLHVARNRWGAIDGD